MISEALIKDLFDIPINIQGNIIEHPATHSFAPNQLQTGDIFSDKWAEVEGYKNKEKLYEFQFEWFLSLYGFTSEADLAKYLKTKAIIIDTGCGLGYKAEWFARLAPHAIVIGVDISDAVLIASKNFNRPNLLFYQCDIADTHFKKNAVDFTVCDQVIMHTEAPQKTFHHLAGVTKPGCEFACYVYAKKALPRELVDDHFRKATHNISKEEMWKLSEQLTELGKRLSELKITFDSPDIPLLGIKGGKYDIQRFIYWNFIKCFWKEEWGFELSTSTNYDWYAPSNAKRFSKDEFLKMVNENNLSVSYFHEEEACYSGRFLKR